MPEVLGIGTDIEASSRFRKHITADHTLSSLISGLFTAEEIRRNMSCKIPYLCFAFGFTCKESVFKALGRGWMNGPVTWQEIECLFFAEPRLKEFEIRLSGGTLEYFNTLGGKKTEGAFEIIDDHVLCRVILWK